MYRQVIFFILTFALGAAAGFYFPTLTPAFQNGDVSEQNNHYHFIDPLLYCQDQNISTQGGRDIKSEISDYIASEQNNGDIVDAAVYFKDLHGGPAATINPDFRSLPASLLKVPVAISIYQHAEKNPGFLAKPILFSTSTNVNQSEHFQPAAQIVAGQTYSVSSLVGYMLKDSDNAALDLLASLLDPQELAASFSNLGVDPPSDAQTYTMNVRTYASFFRILYNGTYLTQDDSEQLLATLAQSTFTAGIVAPLPQGTVVAHKFGESSSTDGKTLGLNDCGIVYKPNHPYLLCIMTKGSNFDTLAKVISTISKKVSDTLNTEQ